MGQHRCSFDLIRSRCAAILSRLTSALLLALLIVSTPTGASARRTADLSAPVVLPAGGVNGDAAWGDYDNDDDLDLLVTGITYTGQRTTILYRSDGGEMNEAAATGLPRVEGSSADWGDYDNDGYLDLLLTGAAGFSSGQVTGLAAVYRNIPHPTQPGQRAFNLGAALPNITQGEGVWGDYNNDGCIDILLTGYGSGGTPLTALYRNDGSGGFVDSGIIFPGLGASSAAWGDYDNDDYLDFVITGIDAGGAPRTLVFRNSGGLEFEEPTALNGVWNGAAAWIDVENDGDLDLLVAGNSGGPASIAPATALYRLENGAFTLTGSAGLPNLWQTSISTGDYNNDGYTDLLINGLTSTNRPTAIYTGSGSFAFSPSGDLLPEGTRISVAWGDFNRDGALDAALAGITVSGSYTTQIYLNDAPPANTPPSAPALTAACWDGANRLTLNWSPSSDDQQGGVTYNVRGGYTHTGVEIQSPEANLVNGMLRLPRTGNAGANTSAVLEVETGRTLKFKVQGVDSTLTGGPFSSELMINAGAPVALADSYTTQEDSPITIRLLDNDNAAYAPLSVYSISAVTGGTLVETGPGIYLFTPTANWSGEAGFTYNAVGVSRYCSTAAVNISVTPVDDAPGTVELEPAGVLERMPPGQVVGQLSAADPDPGDSVTFALAPDGADNLDNALFTVDGSTLRTASELYYADQPYTVNVAATDSSGLSSSARLTVDVQPNTPVAIQCAGGCDGFQTSPNRAAVTMSEDGAPAPFSLTLRAADPDPGDTLAWSLVAPPSMGSVEFDPAAAPGEGQPILYSPSADAHGTDGFVLSVRDGQGHTDQVAVTITVQPVNDAPTLDAPEDLIVDALPDQFSITLTGIGPGAGNEAGQPLTLRAETSAPSLLDGLVIDWDGVSPTARLDFTTSGLEGSADVVLILDDGQAENSQTTRIFNVAVINRPRHYMPLIFGAEADLVP